MKRIATLKPNRTIEYGAGWHIDYDPNTREYLALMNDDVAIIGYAQTRDDARELLFDYIDAQHELNATLRDEAATEPNADELAADLSNGRGVACFTCGGAGACPDCDPIAGLLAA